MQGTAGIARLELGEEHLGAIPGTRAEAPQGLVPALELRAGGLSQRRFVTSDDPMPWLSHSSLFILFILSILVRNESGKFNKDEQDKE